MTSSKLAVAVTTVTRQFSLNRGGREIVNVQWELAESDEQPTPRRAAEIISDNAWVMGSKEGVLPGIVPRPADFDGIHRWQIESVMPPRRCPGCYPAKIR